ncbi:MAG: type III pantothenate kinase [Candidatus Omnitrophica bacterium]|nr:type III pantothenate kinase [Candidatus Omnitrophota bacterium]
MLLAIDIGNTNVSLGLFKKGRLLRRYNIPTKQKSHLSALKKIFDRNKIDDAIVCSVVPQSTVVLEKDLRKLLDKKPQVVGRDIVAPIKNLYRKPKQVGQDRLVNACAGIAFYGVPLIIVDFGTAITFDAISKNEEYLGGMILPGIGISLDALTEQTALLPKIKLDRPKEFIGRDTRNSMLSGVVYGFAVLTDNLTERLKEQIGRKAKVIGTGGNIDLIRKYCKRIDRVDKDLTLKGLNLIYHHR